MRGWLLVVNIYRVLKLLVLIRQKPNLYIIKRMFAMLKMVLGSLQICIMRFTKDYMKTLKKLLEKNPAFKIQTVCQYSYEYNTIRDCGDNDYYHDVNPSTSAFATSKSVESSLISIDETLQSQNMEVHQKTR